MKKNREKYISITEEIKEGMKNIGLWFTIKNYVNSILLRLVVLPPVGKEVRIGIIKVYDGEKLIYSKFLYKDDLYLQHWLFKAKTCYRFEITT